MDSQTNDPPNGSPWSSVDVRIRLTSSSGTSYGISITYFKGINLVAWVPLPSRKNSALLDDSADVFFLPIHLNFVENQIKLDIIPSVFISTTTCGPWNSNLRRWF